MARGRGRRDQRRCAAQSTVRLASGYRAHSLAARVALSRSEGELRVVRANEADATGQLAAAVGVPLSVLRDVPKFLAHQKAHISDARFAEAKQHALLNRSDLLAALAEYDASE